MLNRKHARAEQLDLPVPEGTKSGDPVLVGVMPGVAATDRRADGNATVFLVGGFDLSVEAAEGNAITVGEEIFIDSEGNLTNDDGEGANALFGFALDPVLAGQTEVIEVKVATS